MANYGRPSTFDDIVGQSEVIRRLKINSKGCKISGTVMPHVLIDGPPGLGKTTLAGAIANELDVDLVTCNAASLRSIKSIIPYLMGINPRAVLFIDEIHRLPKLVEEFLYPVMEDFKMSIVVEENTEEIEIPQFTLVGATTSGGSLSQPFYDRFTIKEHLSFYTEIELAKLAGFAIKAGALEIDDSDLLEIAKRSKGTPRILKARVKWYENYVLTMGKDNVDTIFETQGIDKYGMDVYDRKYLEVLEKNLGNPLGLKSISSLTGIAIETIENAIEPYLLREGYVVRTQKGRILGKVRRK
ncbi:MAG TPA: Holliday junction branch migration DNA helicase RuvB [Candidatus Glassbacteria bacterium]|jgi:holliday junction DNA helicase RuvB|nr:Holliday junction branch migration DNA helicase RuvB [Candidatus Glassbacteria bacterium]